MIRDQISRAESALYSQHLLGSDLESRCRVLRSRAKLAKDREIVSTNYAKVMGDLRLDARGGVIFTYY